MPPEIALIICLLIIAFLFWKDRKHVEGVSAAIWIPYTWMFFAASRFASQWIDLQMIIVRSDSVQEGSPLDRTIFSLLILAGSIILFRRRLKWKKVFTENSFLWLFFIFAAISFFWSDYPFVSFKRWLKALGNVVMVLVILSEQKPYAAFGVIIRRLAYVLLPLSVLFIKYYPDLGRSYHMGRPMFTGVAAQKNGLGQLCLLSGVYFSWILLLGKKGLKTAQRTLHYSIYLLVFPMIGWLLLKSNSATSIACLVLALMILLAVSLDIFSRSPRRILHLTLLGAIGFLFLDYFFEIKTTVIHLLGRGRDLTTRVPMWEDLKSMVGNPILGNGFESFWLGERRSAILEEWGVGGQAHNGYLDMYLNLGLFGLFFIFAWIISGLVKVRNYLLIDYPVGLLRFVLIVVVAIYNYTEATFYGVSNMWIIFMIGIMSVPSAHDKKDL